MTGGAGSVVGGRPGRAARPPRSTRSAAGGGDGVVLRPTALVFVLHDADGAAVTGAVAGAAADAARLADLEATLRADVARLWADTPRPAALVGMPLDAVFLVSVVGLPHPRYRALEWRAAVAALRQRLHAAEPGVPRAGEGAADAARGPASAVATRAGALPSLLPRACSKQLPSHAAAMMVGMAWRAVLEADGAATAGAAQGGAAAAAAAALASVSTWVASAGAGVSPAPPPGGVGGGGWPRPPAAGPVGIGGGGGGGPAAAPPSRRQLLALYTADVAANRAATTALAAIDKAARPLSRPPPPRPRLAPPRRRRWRLRSPTMTAARRCSAPPRAGWWRPSAPR